MLKKSCQSVRFRSLRTDLTQLSLFIQKWGFKREGTHPVRKGRAGIRARFLNCI